MASKLKIYPSGFLGNALVAHTAPLDISAIKNRLFDNSPLGNIEGHTANREVESLWDDVVGGDPAYKTFEFREKILRAAIPAFGTDTIYEWIVSQLQSDMHTEYHQRWIDETLQYVLLGKPREYSYNVWFSLITSGHADKSKLNSNVVSSTVGRDGFAHQCTIVEFINRWVSQPRGVDDLIASLHVLFGKR